MKMNNILLSKKIKLIFIILILFLYAFIYLKYNVGIPCIFFEITGLYCPGCGITRAIISLIKLDFIQAFRYNPLIIVVFPFLLIYIIYSTHCWLFDKKNSLHKIPNSILYIILIIIILFGILRNIPHFSYLAPTIIR